MKVTRCDCCGHQSFDEEAEGHVAFKTLGGDQETGKGFVISHLSEWDLCPGCALMIQGVLERVSKAIFNRAKEGGAR